MIDIDLSPNKKKLRSFGYISTAFFAFFATVVFFRSGAIIPSSIFAGLSVFSLSGSLIAPVILKPVYLVLIFISYPIGLVVSNILLALIFILIFFPIGFLLRLTGHDPMGRKLDDKIKTNWVTPKQNKSPASYYQQY